MNLISYHMDSGEKPVERMNMSLGPYGEYEWMKSSDTCISHVSAANLQDRENQREECFEPDPAACQDQENDAVPYQLTTEQPHAGLQQLLERAEDGAKRCTSIYLEDGRINPLLAPFLKREKASEEAKTSWAWSITLQRWYREDKVTNTRIFLPTNPMMRVYLPKSGADRTYQ